LSEAVAKSNQGGIETLPSSVHTLRERRQNRTKVGLKQCCLARLWRPHHRAKSNQGGIETGTRSLQTQAAAWRQNRTKVGLKLSQQTLPQTDPLWQNRTKVGLKPVAREHRHAVVPGQNRTKVGLKPPLPLSCSVGQGGAKSNQGGIETFSKSLGRGLQNEAKSNQGGIETNAR
jgi:hypothetical protein